jgi:hypothetical protein
MVDHVGDRGGKGVQQLEQAAIHRGGGRVLGRRSGCESGEPMGVPVRVWIEPQRAGESVDDLARGVGLPALLQARVVIRAHSRQHRDLLAA